MGWKVVEKEQHAKSCASDPLSGEDRIVVTDEVSVIIDGHSNLENRLIDGKTPGQFVAEAVASFIMGSTEVVDYYRWVGDMSHYVANALRAHSRFEETGEFPRRPGCVLVAFFPRRNIILRIGDGQYFINGHGRNDGLRVDSRKAHIRKEMLRPLMESMPHEMLRQDDPTQHYMRQLLLDWQHQWRNNGNPEWGYGVMDGSPVHDIHIDVTSVPKYTQSIILTSDGYPPHVVKDSAKETELALRKMLRDDPLCVGKTSDGWLGVRGVAPGNDRPDDCSYLRIIRE